MAGVDAAGACGHVGRDVKDLLEAAVRRCQERGLLWTRLHWWVAFREASLAIVYWVPDSRFAAGSHAGGWRGGVQGLTGPPLHLSIQDRVGTGHTF